MNEFEEKVSDPEVEEEEETEGKKYDGGPIPRREEPETEVE